MISSRRSLWKKAIKIVTIGGGNSYTPEWVEGFINRYDTLPVKELCLVDILEGKEKLETVGALVQRMVEKAGMITEAIFRYIHFKKAISLCNVPINITSGFAHMLNKNEKNVTMEIQGINHFIIATDVFVNSKAKFNEIINIYMLI